MVRHRRARRWASTALLAAVLVVGGCSGSDDETASSTPASESTAAPTSTGSPSTTGSVTSTTGSTSTTSTTTEPPTARFDLSAVEVSDLGGSGGGVPATSAAADLVGTGYVESEHMVSGVTNLYEGPAVGPATVTSEDVAYTTRILVRAPEDSADFSGRVVIEPFNTSGGAELDAGWAYLSEQLIDDGDAWIGVTGRVGSVTGLSNLDPDRYAQLALASNGQVWDILSQVGALVAQGDERSPLAGYDVAHLYMTGYSQSGVEIATYANAIHPAARMSDGTGVYDGYLVMARAASMTELDSGDAFLPVLEHRSMGPVDVPVVELLTESDVQGFADPAFTNPGGAAVRRADADTEDDRYRLYEVPGSAHAPMIPGCDGGGTTFPVRYFVRGAYANLVGWVEEDVAAPSAARIETDEIDVVSVLARDEYANALGGVRSPYLEVPLSSYAPTDTPGPICGLAGVETPLDGATLAALYDDAADYLEQFSASLDDTVAAGFVLEADREEILADARDAAQAAL